MGSEKHVQFTPQEVDGALRAYFLTKVDQELSDTSEARMTV